MILGQKTMHAQQAPQVLTLANYSRVVTTTPVLLIPPMLGQSSRYLIIVNNDATNTLWLTRYPGVTPAANAAGCFPIGPGIYYEKSGEGNIPTNGIWAVSSASSVNITAEIG